jgi:cytochrome bd-type quinol oxidase subunit 2
MYKAVAFVSLLCTLALAAIYSQIGIRYMALREKQIKSSTAKEAFHRRKEHVVLITLVVILVSVACEAYLIHHHG